MSGLLLKDLLLKPTNLILKKGHSSVPTSVSTVLTSTVKQKEDGGILANYTLKFHFHFTPLIHNTNQI